MSSLPPLRFLLTGALPCLLAWQPAWAAPDLLETRVRELIVQRLPPGERQELRIELERPAAALPDCEDPRPFLPQPNQRLSGRLAIGVQCAGTNQPARYLQASVGILGEYAIARRAIEPGETVEADMLAMRRGRLERLPRNAAITTDEILGMQATRAIAEGSTFQRSALRAPELIERNAQVVLEARGPGFVISRKATALDSGALDSLVRVRTEAGEILRGRVVGRNRLQAAQ
ncbi:Flagellar protein FlgA [Azotobacter vinelandii CA]|uniref:Flagella basal body P-ring formation protein FlgA n=2 Tax=Azotobacter vinelandii TaxID=354 RepID=C1DHJ1_AZOVD|nr:flagellar basal body P-ring formation chaperone FlgA [Azotobacter vinelandii]ACO78586.1 Flagellar protein FlgA [Azotobacter vinelandii DJ]AGK13473.1 Flagellar protein FlgA [Azotobacter vinelandii CA]AGK17883.1 Flagellar protein FlgA [Azotobacter vinelandii CA6]WKN24268.1 flagellar basal body P-ring formation chaperone FlgA [Azotobacter vinelandii]SFX89496.1 flagella basal body P-ring formation protein FlgA [Azotobacter vinelandii]